MAGEGMDAESIIARLTADEVTSNPGALPPWTWTASAAILLLLLYSRYRS